MTGIFAGMGGIGPPNGLGLSGQAKSPSDYRAELAGSACLPP